MTCLIKIPDDLCRDRSEAVVRKARPEDRKAKTITFNNSPAEENTRGNEPNQTVAPFALGGESREPKTVSVGLQGDSRASTSRKHSDAIDKPESKSQRNSIVSTDLPAITINQS